MVEYKNNEKLTKFVIIVIYKVINIGLCDDFYIFYKRKFSKNIIISLIRYLYYDNIFITYLQSNKIFKNIISVFD